MIIFWTLAAGLMGLAILFIALPLLRDCATDAAPGQGELNLQVCRQRLEELDADLTAGVLNQAQYAAARKDLERELLSDLSGSDRGGDPTIDSNTQATTKQASGRAPWLALVLAMIVPTTAVLTYRELGDQGIIGRTEAAAASGVEGHPAGADGPQIPDLDTLVQGLAERLEQNPESLDGWLMLGRTYFALEQPAKALEAMERAYKLAPDDAGVMVAYAEAVAANNGNQLDGRPAELIRAALAREPGNPSVRWLSGMLAYQQERFAEAVATWQGVLDEMDPAGQEAQEMRQMIAEARGRDGLPESAADAPSPTARTTAAPLADAAPSPGIPAVQTAASGPGSAAANTGARIQVSVSLASALAAQASPDDTVFIFARAAAGPPMPLAVSRIKVADLPATVTLDDSMAVMPTMRLSAFPQIVVGARVSKSGQATPGPGDLEGQVGPVDARGSPVVAVLVDRVRP